ncbi:hypothetical protein [Bacillus sp. NTK034]|uniref:hypothetical protein n=1 Tax=Bacillus sp. NTK034 TaxID=2802176 RepID=UPI001A8EBA6E|nr:hypothetical protein [Bacillus sp. NTK034]MBN8203488.1 hypothetical protein [Bacillus sp. NTK034]
MQAKLLGQAIHSIKITEQNKVFGEVIQASWNDFNNKKTFNESIDKLALITGPISATETVNVRNLLNQDHHSKMLRSLSGEFRVLISLVMDKEKNLKFLGFI